MISEYPRLHSAVRSFKQRVRGPLLHKLRSLPWYRKLSLLSRNEIVSCRDYVLHGEGANDDTFIPLHRHERVPIPPGEDDLGEGARLFGHVTAVEFPPTFVAALSECRIYGRGVAVIGADGRLLREGSVHIGGSTEDHAVLKRCWLPAPVRLPGTTAILAAPAGATYYHWIFDVLPRLALLRLAGFDLGAVDRVAVNSFGRPHQKETLARCGIHADRLVETDRLRHVVCERMLLPSYPGTSSLPPRWVCDFLRETFLEPSRGTERGSSPERIYVSRQRSRSRRVRNQDDLDQLLEAAGIATVFLEDLSVRQQARLFRDAKLIVAPHGSGLSNLVFGIPGATVIELFPPGVSEIHYWFLCRQLGIRHLSLVGESAPRAGSSQDFVVPAEALERLLERSR